MPAILVIDAMESVSANALFVPGVRARVNLCFVGQSAMKAGVENRNLRNSGKEFCREINAFQSRFIVQRSYRGNVRNCLTNLRRDHRTLGEFRSAMHDAVANDADFGSGLQDGSRTTPDISKHRL